MNSPYQGEKRWHPRLGGVACQGIAEDGWIFYRGFGGNFNASGGCTSETWLSYEPVATTPMEEAVHGR